MKNKGSNDVSNVCENIQNESNGMNEIRNNNSLISRNAMTRKFSVFSK